MNKYKFNFNFNRRATLFKQNEKADLDVNRLSPETIAAIKDIGNEHCDCPATMVNNFARIARLERLCDFEYSVPTENLN